MYSVVVVPMKIVVNVRNETTEAVPPPRVTRVDVCSIIPNIFPPSSTSPKPSFLYLASFVRQFRKATQRVAPTIPLVSSYILIYFIFDLLRRNTGIFRSRASSPAVSLSLRIQTPPICSLKCQAHPMMSLCANTPILICTRTVAK